MTHIVIVHENADLRDALVRLMEKARAQTGRQGAERAGAEIHALAAFEQARQYLQGRDLHAVLFVIGAAAPEVAGGVVDNNDHQAARTFLHDAMARCPATPLLVLSTEEHDRHLLRDVERHAAARLVTVRSNLSWKKTAAGMALAALGGSKATDDRETAAVLRIDVFNDRQGGWTLEQAGRVEGKLGGPLTIDPDDLAFIFDDSRDLAAFCDRSDWDRAYRKIGGRLEKMLFGDRNAELRSVFDEATREDLLRPQLRLVFGLEECTHDLPVETLKRRPVAANDGMAIDPMRAPSVLAEWHALNSPMVRQYQPAGGRIRQATPRSPLFWDRDTQRRPLKCLLVAADPKAGFIHDEPAQGGQGDVGFHGLPEAEREVDDIAALLERSAASGTVESVKVLKLGPERDPQGALFKTLGSDCWDLLHFAGHSVELASRSGRPALILRATSDGECGFDALARVLPDVRFLFLSSCRSAGTQFLRLLLQEHVPAVLGYRWPVRDDRARELATSFYSALFRRGEAFRSLDRSLLHARKETFRLRPESPAWASPLLLTQDTSAAARAHLSA